MQKLLNTDAQDKEIRRLLAKERRLRKDIRLLAGLAQLAGFVRLCDQNSHLLSETGRTQVDFLEIAIRLSLLAWKKRYDRRKRREGKLYSLTNPITHKPTNGGSYEYLR